MQNLCWTSLEEEKFGQFTLHKRCCQSIRTSCNLLISHQISTTIPRILRRGIFSHCHGVTVLMCAPRIVHVLRCTSFEYFNENHNNATERKCEYCSRMRHALFVQFTVGCFMTWKSSQCFTIDVAPIEAWVEDLLINWNSLKCLRFSPRVANYVYVVLGYPRCASKRGHCGRIVCM